MTVQIFMVIPDITGYRNIEFLTEDEPISLMRTVTLCEKAKLKIPQKQNKL